MPNAPAGGAKAPNPSNPPKPNPRPDVNEPSNVRPSSKPTPEQTPDPAQAAGNDEQDNVPEPGEDIENVGE